MRAASRAVGLSGGTTSDRMAVPDAAEADGAQLFENQWRDLPHGHASDPERPRPALEGVGRREAGSVEDVHHSPGFAEADWSWDEAHLAPWLANPQAAFTGAMMPYRQGQGEVTPAVRRPDRWQARTRAAARAARRNGNPSAFSSLGIRTAIIGDPKDLH